MPIRTKNAPRMRDDVKVGYEAQYSQMADFIHANPPLNVSDWCGERLREDKRWKYGVLPKG
jgi:type I restriction-modification system DNA methylase subunit